MAAINAKERQEIKEYIEQKGTLEYVGILTKECTYSRKNNENVILFIDKEDDKLYYVTYRNYSEMKRLSEQGCDCPLYCTCLMDEIKESRIEQYKAIQRKHSLENVKSIIEVNNVKYSICEDIFGILDIDEYEDELFEFCSLLTTVENPQFFKINGEQRLCVRLEDMPIVLTQFMPPETKPEILQKWYEIIDSLQELIEQNIE